MLEFSDLAILGGGLASIVGGLWMLWKHFRPRKEKPRVIARIVCRIQDHYDRSGARIADIRLIVKNTGSERLTISSIFMSVRGINRQITSKINGQLNQENFPINIDSKRRMFSGAWKHSYANPGQTISYKQLTKIPAGVKMISIHGKIECPDPRIVSVTATETIEV